MKPNQEAENEESLRTVLREWVVEASLPPRFQERVWKRIEQVEARPTPVELLSSMLRMFQLFFSRPKIALSYVAILLAVGVTAGTWAAQAQTSRLDSALSMRYVQSVDPYKAIALNP